MRDRDRERTSFSLEMPESLQSFTQGVQNFITISVAGLVWCLKCKHKHWLSQSNMFKNIFLSNTVALLWYLLNYLTCKYFTKGKQSTNSLNSLLHKLLATQVYFRVQLTWQRLRESNSAMFWLPTFASSFSTLIIYLTLMIPKDYGIFPACFISIQWYMPFGHQAKQISFCCCCFVIEWQLCMTPAGILTLLHCNDCTSYKWKGTQAAIIAVSSFSDPRTCDLMISIGNYLKIKGKQEYSFEM